MKKELVICLILAFMLFFFQAYLFYKIHTVKRDIHEIKIEICELKKDFKELTADDSDELFDGVDFEEEKNLKPLKSIII